jgi:hypothetical protein
VRINPVQSRLGVLRKKSQIYWVMGVGVLGVADGDEGTNGREARSSPTMEGSPVAKEDQDISREMGERLSLDCC